MKSDNSPQTKPRNKVLANRCSNNHELVIGYDRDKTADTHSSQGNNPKRCLCLHPVNTSSSSFESCANKCKHKRKYGKSVGDFPNDKIARICEDCGEVIDIIEPISSGVIK